MKEDTNCSFDGLLSHSLMLFRQFHFYDTPASEEEALHDLEVARRLMAETEECVNMAKWGCTLECLTQKFYINIDTDEVLGEIDLTLISFWKKNETSVLENFRAYLWLGYYFLLRIRSRESRFHNRNKRVVCDILSFLIDVLHRFKKGTVAPQLLLLFSIDAWTETVYWAELIHDAHINEKLSTTLLRLLYDVKKAELSKDDSEEDVLLQRILDFYCFS